MTHRRLARWTLVTLAGLAHASSAGAFCGFFVSGSNADLSNGATRVALMRSGTRTVLSMSNDYDGPPENFAMVVPVPVVLSRETVRTLPHDVFARLDALTAPRLVEYWEQDPCPAPRDMVRSVSLEMGVVRTTSAADVSEMSESAARVRVEARFAVGEYEVVILSADESSGLESWLRANRYNIPRGAAEALAPYVRGEWKFFVARVDMARTQPKPGGGVRLSPLRMQYDSTEFRLPVRLGLLNAPPSPQDLIVYVLHPSARIEVANYRNVFIPTNLDLVEGARERFAGVYGALFDATLQSSGRRAVITEYAWSTGGCDPCPTPPLEASELATLGADALPDFDGARMVVTRLHTRYSAETLTDDLVLREAYPATGGHERHFPAGGSMDESDTRAQLTSSGNRFQARYAIRHPWEGPIACEHPRRGVWGASPERGAAPVRAVEEGASASRDGISLRSMVRTPVTAIDLDARLSLTAGAPAAASPTLIPSRGMRRGCACSTLGSQQRRAEGGAGRCALIAGALALGARRRRR